MAKTDETDQGRPYEWLEQHERELAAQAAAAGARAPDWLRSASDAVGSKASEVKDAIDSTNLFGPEGNIRKAASSIPVLGGALDMGRDMVGEMLSQGPVGSMLLGTDKRFEGLTPGTPEYKAAERERLTGYATNVGLTTVGKAAAKAAAPAVKSASNIVDEYTEFLKTGKLPETNPVPEPPVPVRQNAADRIAQMGDVAAEPPLAPGMVRLYRGQSTLTGHGSDAGSVRSGFAGNDEHVRFFTTDKEYARKVAKGTETGSTPFGDRPGTGQVVHLDVPADVAARYNLTNNPAALAAEKRISDYRGFDDQIFVVPKDVAQTAADIRRPIQNASPIATTAGGKAEVARIGGQAVADAAVSARGVPGFALTAEQKLGQQAEEATGAVLGGGKADLGFQNETFSPQSQPVLAAAKDALRDKIAPRVAPITQQDTLLAAQMTGRPAEQAAKMLPKRGQLSKTVTEVALGIEEKLARADAVAAKAGPNRSTADRLAALLEMKEAGTMLKEFSEGASEIGRALAARKIAIQRELALNPTEAGYREALRKIMGAGFTDKKADAMLDALALVRGDRAATFKLLRELNTSSFWDKAFEFSQANILSAIPTHLTNVYSGTIQHALMLGRVVGETAVNVAGGAPKALIGKGTAGSSWEDVAAFGAGYQSGLGSVASRTVNLLRRRQDFYEYAQGGIAAKHGGESILPGGAIPGRVGEAVRTPFKLLTIEDLFQTMPSFNGRLRQLASQEARKEGLGGLAQLKRAAEIADNPSDQMIREANAFAERYALHTRGEKLQATTNLIHSIPGLRYLVRFTTTPTNLVQMGLEHSPLGLARLLSSGNRKAKKAQIATEAAIGTVIVGHMLSMLEDGKISGLRPSSKAEQDMWEAEGAGPMMIRSSEVPFVGGMQHLFNANGDADKRWVTAGVLGPLMVPMLMAAAIREVESQQESPDPKRMQQAVGAMVRTFADQVPMLQGIGTTQNLMENPQSAATDLLASTAKTFVPASALLSMVERITDQYRRDPEGLMETLQGVIPVLASQGVDLGPLKVRPLRTRLDVFGQPVEQNTGATGLFPRGTVQEPPDPVLQEARRLLGRVDGFIGITKTDREKVGSVQVSPDGAHRYQELAGQNTKRLLTELVNAPHYRDGSLTDVERAKQFTDHINTARLEAQKTLAQEYMGIVVNPDGSVTNVQRTESDHATGIAIGMRATKNLNERAKFIEQILPSLEKNAGLADAVASEMDGRPRTKPIETVATRVIDGDTVAVQGFSQGIRLVGVDVPERNTPAGAAAAAALEQFLAGKKLTYAPRLKEDGVTIETAIGGRPVADLRANGESVSDWLIKQGLGKPSAVKASDPDKYSLDTYKRAIPMLKEVAAMPEYANARGVPIGNEAIWAQVEKDRPLWTEYAKKNGNLAADRQFPLYSTYRRISPKNPVKNKYIADAEKQGVPLSKFTPD